MKHLLDSSICVDLIRDRGDARERLADLNVGECCVSSIVLAELETGALKAPNRRREEAVLADFLSGLAVLPFGPEAAREYARIRADLESRGQPLHAHDLLIAAHAKSEKLALIASDGDFARVPGLKLHFVKR